MIGDEDEYIKLSLSSKEDNFSIELLVLRSSVEELVSKYGRKVEISSFFDDSFIRNVIHNLGVASNLKGYNYLIEAIKITLRNNIYNTNDIYREISKKYNVSINSIEHAIRKSISISFDIGDINLIHNIFGYSIRDIPTNTQYILMVSEYINLHLN